MHWKKRSTLHDADPTVEEIAVWAIEDYYQPDLKCLTLRCRSWDVRATRPAFGVTAPSALITIRPT